MFPRIVKVGLRVFARGPSGRSPEDQNRMDELREQLELEEAWKADAEGDGIAVKIKKHADNIDELQKELDELVAKSGQEGEVTIKTGWVFLVGPIWRIFMVLLWIGFWVGALVAAVWLAGKVWAWTQQPGQTAAQTPAPVTRVLTPPPVVSQAPQTQPQVTPPVPQMPSGTTAVPGAMSAPPLLPPTPTQSRADACAAIEDFTDCRACFVAINEPIKDRCRK